MIAAEAVSGLVSALGGRRNAGAAAVIVAGLMLATNLLARLGAQWVAPGDRIAIAELGLHAVNIRIDSTNLVMRLHQDSVTINRAENQETQRAMLVLLCDRVAPQRLQDLKLLTKCRRAQDGL